MEAASRKEWRVISDHQNSGDEGTEQVNSEFFPITVDGGSEHELHLDDVVKQREQLQHLEVNLKARLIARSDVIGMQEHFDSQIKDHIASTVKLQEQLREREAAIMDLQRTLDDKDKELYAIRLDHQASWAKEDLLREQNKELATFRRERDNLEAERAQHLQKIHDLQELVQEKEQHFIELQEQHRVAQETIIFKDEQIREAQAWIARVQEMDALQSTTNHSLQAELRDRTEQYNQFWLGCQRQFSEMERLHQLKIQQLETELSDARERNGTKSDGSRMSQTNVKDISDLVHGNGSQLEASSESKGLQNGDTEVVSSQTDNILSVQMTPQSLHGMPNYFPPGQITAMHPFILHHQNANSHLVQSHVGQFHSLPANASIPHWQNQQAFSESLQMQNNDQYPSQNDQNLSRPETNYNYEASVNGQVNEAEQQSLQQISSQFHGSLRLNHSGNEITHQEKNANSASEVIRSVMVSDATPNKVDSAAHNNYLVGKTAEKTLFDEETLLACVVRTIPPGPGGRIQISSTLLSRLTKMLAPLLWSDYENKHGKLDVFLGSHPELFVINGDYIQVREGAQEIIAGMVARAKHRAATISASATSSHPSLLSSVAVTPMAQTRLKKPQSVNSNYANAERNRFNESQQSVNSNYPNAERNRFIESQQSNGVSFNPVGVRVLRKQNDELKLANGNGINLDRPNYHGKQQGRSTGALPGSRN